MVSWLFTLEFLGDLHCSFLVIHIVYLRFLFLFSSLFLYHLYYGHLCYSLDYLLVIHRVILFVGVLVVTFAIYLVVPLWFIVLFSLLSLYHRPCSHLCDLLGRSLAIHIMIPMVVSFVIHIESFLGNYHGNSLYDQHCNLYGPALVINIMIQLVFFFGNHHYDSHAIFLSDQHCDSHVGFLCDSECVFFGNHLMIHIMIYIIVFYDSHGCSYCYCLCDTHCDSYGGSLSNTHCDSHGYSLCDLHNYSLGDTHYDSDGYFVYDYRVILILYTLLFILWCLRLFPMLFILSFTIHPVVPLWVPLLFYPVVPFIIYLVFRSGVGW